VLSYVQGGAADMWKENVLEKLEAGELEFETVGEFLAEIKKEFGRGEEESVKAAELKKLEQGGRQWRNLFKNLRGQQEEVGMKEGCWWKNLREK